ncbi:MAG: undecaprenyl diphosphate synthase family protein, partial [Patescibacteria group bacterium]
YNGTTEMLEAIRKITEDKGQRTKDITEIENALRKHLWTGELPDVDLIMRTGSTGDPHNSTGFMMWLTRESQFYFTDTYFPDFGKEELQRALEEYARRERRLGK